MSATTHTCTLSVSHRIRSLAGRTWPALLTLLTLACVTPPSSANASPPAAGSTACDGGTCGEQAKPPAPLPVAPPAAPVATPTETRPSAPAPAPAPTTVTSTPPAAPTTASSVQPQCDSQWDDGQAVRIQLSSRKDDGKPLEPFKPYDPLYPYEVRGGRYLFTRAGLIYTMVGRFDDDKEAEAVSRTLEAQYPSTRPFVTTLGPYLVTESPACKVTQSTRVNPVIDPASWILEKEGVLLAGTQTACSNGTLTKKVTVISCDGKKNLLTDSVNHVCDGNRRVDTCVHTLEPGVLLLEHAYTISGATSVSLRVYDVRKKKRLFTQASSYGPGLPGFGPDNNEPETHVEDVDQDGVPEIVTVLPQTKQRASVRKWHKGKFVETRSP